MASRSEQIGNGDDHRRPPSSSPLENPSCHFFKIILPTTLDEKKLKLPKKFVHLFGDELSEFARLIFPNGYSWKVGLNKEKNDIEFDDGWHDFVVHHSISKGYFLVFEYKGFSEFTVWIFDSSACEIQYPSNDYSNCQKCRVPNPDRMDCDTDKGTSFERKVCEACGCEGECGKGVPSLVRKPRMKKRGRGVASVGSPSLKQRYDTRNKNLKTGLLDDSSDEDANESRDELADCKTSWPEGTKVRYSEKKSAPKYKENTTEIITSRKLTDEKCSPESMQAINAARKYKPEAPSFMVVLSSLHCNTHVMYVPLRFSEIYLCYAPNYIQVEVSDGRGWVVRLLRSRKHKYLGGLNAFFLDNDLKVGDVCVFEWIQKNRSLKASIFHANEVDPVVTSRPMSDFTEESPETKRAVQAARSYNPEHPSFMVILRMLHFRHNVLYVPRGISARLNGAHNNIRLKVSDGREWNICSVSNSIGAIYLIGLKAFHMDNNTKVGDVCVFELITNKELKASVFRAHGILGLRTD